MNTLLLQHYKNCACIVTVHWLHVYICMYWTTYVCMYIHAWTTIVYTRLYSLAPSLQLREHFQPLFNVPCLWNGVGESGLLAHDCPPGPICRWGVQWGRRSTGWLAAEATRLSLS